MPNSDPSIKRPRILVIRFSSLGDIVLTAPVFRALRQQYAHAHISFLVKEQYADVLAANADIDEQLVLQKKEPLVSLIRRVRKERFDIILDLHANVRSRLVCLFANARHCYRYRKAVLARRLFVEWRLPSTELQRHTLERYMDALKPMGIMPLGKRHEAKKIALIQTAFLGDAVLTTPLLTALQEHYPSASLSVVCTPEILEVFERHPAVHHLIVYDKRGKEKSWKALWKLGRKLKSDQFDIAFVPHRSLTSALLAWWSDASRRIGFSSSQGRWLFTDIVPFRWETHDADRNLQLLRAVGISKEGGELWVQPAPDAVRAVQDRLLQEGVCSDDFVVGISPASQWATKRWLPERFAVVADRAVRELGAKIIFFGSLHDQEVVQQVLHHMKEPSLNWAGKTSLRELIAGIARCQTFLTNDSGPMHIAVGTQVPTVAIFGPTTRELGFFPYGPGHRVIEKDLPCRPCGLHGSKSCPLGHFECMKQITSDDVFEAVVQQARSQTFKTHSWKALSR